MRIYAAADIHGKQYRLNLMLSHIKEHQPDIVIIPGDITQFGPGSLATTLLNEIPVETYAVRGNCDTPEVNNGINESKATNLSLTRITVHQKPLVGCEPAGDVGNPYLDTSTLQFLAEHVDSETILVSHLPPYGIQDTIYKGNHGGNKELTHLITTYTPAVLLCGHIHEAPGCTTYKNTVVVNCSIGKKTEGALIDITDKTRVTILD